MKPILYRPGQRWQIWAALACAALLHAAAIAVAASRAVELPPLATPDKGVDFEIVQPDSAPEVPSPPDSEPLPVEPPRSDEEIFVEDHPTPPPPRHPPRPAVRPLVRQTLPGTAGTSPMSSAKVSATTAPRPEYPYEARRQRLTGSGVALLRIDASGAVTEVSMMQSTGATVLDKATLAAFRRWRFRPGAVSTVRCPITFTLTGASY